MILIKYNKASHNKMMWSHRYYENWNSLCALLIQDWRWRTVWNLTELQEKYL